MHTAAAGHRLDNQVLVACMDMLPEPCKRDSTQSWGDASTAAGATEPSHATFGDDKPDEHESQCHLPVAAQVEAEMDDALGTFLVTETLPAST